VIANAAERYAAEVRDRTFPGPAHVFSGSSKAFSNANGEDES